MTCRRKPAPITQTISDSTERGKVGVHNCLSFVKILLDGSGPRADVRLVGREVLLSGRSADAGQWFTSAGARRSVFVPAMIEGSGERAE